MRPPWTVLAALAVAASCASGAAFAAVDANSASVDALRTVRGVGPRIAQRIVDERRRGPYASLDDLQARVRGVGPGSARKMAAAGLTVGRTGRVPAVVERGTGRAAAGDEALPASSEARRGTAARAAPAAVAGGATR